MTKQIGFTAKLNKPDELSSKEVAHKNNMKAFRKVIAGVGIFITLVGGIGSCAVSSYKERKEQQAIELKSYTEKKDAERAKKKAQEPTMEEWQENGRITKEMTANTPISKVKSVSIVDTFNKEIQSTPENAIFDFKFSSKGGQLFLTVDVTKASQHFGVDENTTKLGISQGSDVYVSYVNRYNSKENKNSSLQIVDKHGKLIAEVR